MQVRIWYAMVILVSSVLAGSVANAMSPLLREELKRLDPQTRLEQRCDIEAMEAIAKSTKFSPDKAIAYAFADPITTKDTINAKGAAFRARGKWYHFSFFCLGTADHLGIVKFDYRLGEKVPRDQWDAHYLVP